RQGQKKHREDRGAKNENGVTTGGFHRGWGDDNDNTGRARRKVALASVARMAPPLKSIPAAAAPLAGAVKTSVSVPLPPAYSANAPSRSASRGRPLTVTFSLKVTTSSF